MRSLYIEFPLYIKQLVTWKRVIVDDYEGLEKFLFNVFLIPHIGLNPLLRCMGGGGGGHAPRLYTQTHSWTHAKAQCVHTHTYIHTHTHTHTHTHIQTHTHTHTHSNTCIYTHTLIIMGRSKPILVFW